MRNDDFQYQVQVLGHLDLGNEWAGWRLRGKFLISPNGDRVMPGRLIGILVTESLRKRGQAKRPAAGRTDPTPTPVVVELRRHVA